MGRLARAFFLRAVGKSSAKMSWDERNFLACLGVCRWLIRAHNPKVVGSNPASATKKDRRSFDRLFFFALRLKDLKGGS